MKAVSRRQDRKSQELVARGNIVVFCFLELGNKFFFIELQVVAERVQ